MSDGVKEDGIAICCIFCNTPEWREYSVVESGMIYGCGTMYFEPESDPEWAGCAGWQQSPGCEELIRLRGK
jgi:hypothetical protein